MQMLLYRLFLKKVRKKFGALKKNAYLCTRKTNEQSSESH